MSFPLCETCGTQYDRELSSCPICSDERQYVGWNGQRWITLETLAQNHKVRLEDDAGIPAIGTLPAFAIDQRALLLQTARHRIMWECVSLVTPEAVAAAFDLANSKIDTQPAVLGPGCIDEAGVALPIFTPDGRPARDTKTIPVHAGSVPGRNDRRFPDEARRLVGLRAMSPTSLPASCLQASSGRDRDPAVRLNCSWAQASQEA